MAVSPSVRTFGWQAADFKLPATDGRQISLADVRGEKGTLVMFICNHCPYVIRALEQIKTDARDLAGIGVRSVAISSNDVVNYPQDSFENMQSLAQQHDFPFPYLYDEDQSVARAYDAACTPDFFGFDRDLKLRYAGRLVAPDGTRELFDGMRLVAETGQGPDNQVPSMGCSIKWK